MEFAFSFFAGKLVMYNFHALYERSSMKIESLEKDRFGRDKKLTVTLVPGVSVELTPQQLKSADLKDSELNLRYAEEHGIKPLSYQDVIKQMTPEASRYIVLFDIAKGLSGNYWRVVGEDQKKVVLRKCEIFGNYDEHFPEISVPFDTPMFTGVSVELYERNGEILPLSETVDLINSYLQGGMYPELEHCEEILFSDQKGTLKSVWSSE